MQGRSKIAIVLSVVGVLSIVAVAAIFTSGLMTLEDDEAPGLPPLPSASMAPMGGAGLPSADGTWSGDESQGAPPVPPHVRLGGGYGMRPNRTTGEMTFHAGVDFPAPIGTPVNAPWGGIVRHITREERPSSGFDGYGNAIVAYHPDLGRWSLYAHLDAVLVEEGDWVPAGSMIGKVGNTNNGEFAGMGSHLHFEVRHPTRDGESPFPGAYERHNENPRIWLAQLGVVYGEDGRLASSDDG